MRWTKGSYTSIADVLTTRQRCLGWTNQKKTYSMREGTEPQMVSSGSEGSDSVQDHQRRKVSPVQKCVESTLGAISKITLFGGTCNPTAGLKEVGEPEETLQGPEESQKNGIRDR
ncbi:unnamed protein product [Arctogadus glacialis]